MARVHPGTIHHQYRYAIKGFSIEMPEAAAIAISQDPRVDFVEQDGYGRLATTQSPTPSWGLDRIDQTNLPLDSSYSYNETGSMVNAYVIDSGIRSSHADFGGRVLFGIDTVGDGLNGADCTTQTPDGHGTLVAGVLGGSTYGVAKAVRIYNVRVTPCTTFFTTAQFISGVDWVTGNQVKPAVANLSFETTMSTAFDKALRRTIASGVIVVVAAGNDTMEVGGSSPSDVTQAIIVGNTDINDNLATDSNFGPSVALLAPGTRITSDSAAGDTATATVSGTSFSSPHVAGAIARYLQTNPTACQCTVKQVITSIATPGVIGGVPADTPNLLLFTPLAWPTPTYYSLSLDGSTGYVDVPGGGQGVSLNITGAVTVEAWINTNSTMIHQGIIERYNNSAGMGTNDGGYALRINNHGKIQFLTLQNGVQFDSITSNAAISSGGWHHVAGVFDGSQMRIYIDGNRDNFKSSTFAPVTGTTDVKIGVQADGTGFFNGLIDEARVTGAAVYTGSTYSLAHHLTGVAGTVGLWRFDNQTAQDCALVNNGTLVGGATFSTNFPAP
jgi:hypothetical protein